MNAIERAKALQQRAMEKPTASKEFIADFMKVSKHYLCSPTEIEIMKQLARDNMKEAQGCFASLAKEIN